MSDLFFKNGQSVTEGAVRILSVIGYRSNFVAVVAALAHTVADSETPRCDPRINFPLGYPSKTLVSLPEALQC